MDFFLLGQFVGLAETVIPPVERFQKDTGLKVALDWYWWFKEMPGTFYPDYWPPREGAEKFKADVQRLKASGAFTQVYLNGMTWDEDAPSWKDGGIASVAMRRDGTYFSCAYNRFNPNHHLANLCGEAPKFQTRIREQVAHLVDCGFDSIYLDMIGCNAYGPCFNPAHRHASGGGSHMTDGFRAYLQGLKAAFPGTRLSTEDCGDSRQLVAEGATVEARLAGSFGRRHPRPARVEIDQTTKRGLLEVNSAS